MTLAVSTLCIGGYLSALISPRADELNPSLEFLEFTLLPSIGVGALVAYFLLRKLAVVRADQSANELLKDIPNPDKIKGTEDT